MSKQSQSDRSNPRKNKSLAIRNVLRQHPNAKAPDVAAQVKKEFGLEVSQNMVYMVKTKNNMISDGRPRRSKGTQTDSPMTSPALWVEAIKIARHLLKVTGGVENATALLKAVGG